MNQELYTFLMNVLLGLNFSLATALGWFITSEIKKINASLDKADKRLDAHDVDLSVLKTEHKIYHYSSETRKDGK